MEVRVIDPQNPNEHHAGRVQGTVIRVIHPKHHPAPSPYRFLIKRALKPIHHAGETGRESFLANSSHETDEDFSSPPATSPSITEGVSKLWQHHRFGTERSKCRSEDQEAKDGPAQAGLSGSFASISGGSMNSSRTSEEHPASTTAYPTRGKSTRAKGVLKEGVSRRTRVLRTVLRDDGGSHQPHQNAEIVRTDSRGSPRECQSAPSYPAPNSNLWEASWFIVGLVGFLSFAVVAINYGGSTLGDTALAFMAITFFTWLLLSPDTLSENQNAEVEGHTLFLLRKTSSEQTSSSQNLPPPASAPNSKQNAGNSEKFVPPGMESRSPCASRSSKPMEVIVGSHKFFSPFGRFLDKVLERTLSKLLDRILPYSAFNDPSREMTCFGWRKKA